MLERLILHGAALAHRAARARLAALAEALRDEAPEGVGVSEEEGAVALSGRGLKRRFALDPKLRWLFLRPAQDELGRRR
jgi:hypothetical protein